MLLPKGTPLELNKKGKPSDYLEKDITGYIQLSWREDGELCVGTVVLRNGEPVLASVEKAISKEKITGNEAFQKITNIEIATVDVYSLTEDKLELAIKSNKDSIIEKVKSDLQIPTPASPATGQHISEKASHAETPVIAGLDANLMKLLYAIGSFTGILKAEGEGREAIVAVEDGNIVGVKITYNNEVLKGNPALEFLDFYGKVYAFSRDVNELLKDDPEIQVLDREELLKKYKIPVPDDKEIEQLISQAFEHETALPIKDKIEDIKGKLRLGKILQRKR